MVAVRKRTAEVVACVGLLVAGCTSNTGIPGASTSSSATDPSTNSSSSTTSTTSTPPSTPTTSSAAPADPRVAAAANAYEAFAKALAVSEQHPPKAVNDPYAPGGNFARYMFDPARAEYVGQILSLTQLQVAYRGTPPKLRVSVTKVDLGAKPYPTVVVADCPVPPKWKIVATTPGPPPTVKSSPSTAPPPYLTTAQLIFFQNRWGVYKIAMNSKKTCTP